MNYFIDTFLNYTGAITRRRYWALVFFLFLLLFSTNLNMLTLPIRIGMRQELREIFINQGLNQIFSSLFPLRIIIVAFTAVSLFIITIKRSRTLKLSKAKTWRLAISIYMLIFVPFSYSQALINFSEQYADYLPLSENTIMYLTLCLILLFSFVWGITSLVKLSKQTDLDKDNERTENYDMNTENCALQFFRLLVLYFSITLILSFFSLSTNAAIFIKIPIAIGFIAFYLYIFSKRAKDAGIKPVIFYSSFAVFLVIALSTYVLLMYVRFEFGDKFFIKWIVGSLFYISLISFSILSNILMILPSKKNITSSIEDSLQA